MRFHPTLFCLLALMLAGCAPKVGTIRAHLAAPQPATVQTEFKQAWCRDLPDGSIDLVAYALRPAQRPNPGSLDVTGSGTGYYSIWLRLSPSANGTYAISMIVPLDRPPFTPAPYAAAEELAATAPASAIHVSPSATAQHVTVTSLPARWSAEPDRPVTLDLDITAQIASDVDFSSAASQYENARHLLIPSSTTRPTSDR